MIQGQSLPRIDTLAVSGGGDKEKRRYCCHAAATLAETEIWEVMNDREDT